MAYGDEYDPNQIGSDGSDQAPADPAKTPATDTRKRYKTTANWQDPFTPPSPGDPYWNEWIAANPDYTGDRGTTGTVTSGLPSLNGRVTDPATIRKYVMSWAGMADADPTLSNNPDYAVQRIIQTGGLGSDNTGYWQNAFVGPNAFYKNPNRESGNKDTTTKIDNGPVNADNWFSSNSPAPASYSSLARPDSLAASYTPAKWGETFKAPSADDLLTDPGYIAGRDSMQQGLERAAASKGSILSGGFVGKALPRALGQYAGQAYDSLANRSFDSYKQRYGQFLDAQQADLTARGLNETTYQTDLNNQRNQYLTRYQSYRDAIGDNFSLANLGLNATNAGNPGQPI